MSQCIRYTNFSSDPDGNGAEKRTDQIGELLAKAGIEFDLIKQKQDQSFKVVTVFKNLFEFIFILKPLKYAGFKRFFHHLLSYSKTNDLLHKNLESSTKIFLWECTRSENYFIPFLVKKYNKVTIGLPHNLESLVPNQISRISLKKSPHWLMEEISYLSKCDAVFCISREETWLLRLFGINAFHLPYYPTEYTVKKLLEIREQRTSLNNRTSDRKILLFGSANNQPTRLGMIEMINILKGNTLNKIQFYIAGFNTNSLTEFIQSEGNIILLGSLEKDKMVRLLSEIDAVLIHQFPTSGALIKIPEMLIAGIPVIANSVASRSYSYDGLYTYDDNKTLLEFLLNMNFKIPPIPKKPTDLIYLFVNKIIKSILN